MSDLSGLPVKCPNCKGSHFITTDKYDPDVSPNGSMVSLRKKYASWPLDWLCTSGTKAAELTCPECLGQLAHSGRLLVVMPEEEKYPYPEELLNKISALDERAKGIGLDAVIAVNTLNVPIRDGSPQAFVDGDSVLIVDPKNFQFICPTCGKECKSQLGLNSHMRSHEGKES